MAIHHFELNALIKQLIKSDGKDKAIHYRTGTHHEHGQGPRRSYIKKSNNTQCYKQGKKGPAKIDYLVGQKCFCHACGHGKHKVSHLRDRDKYKKKCNVDVGIFIPPPSEYDGGYDR